MISFEQIQQFMSVLVPAKNADINWAVQRIYNMSDCKGFDYSDKTDYYQPTEEYCRAHFSGKPVGVKGGHRGSLAIRLNHKNTLKIICIDADDPYMKEMVLKQIVPELRKRGADPIIEHSDHDRVHVWIKVFPATTEQAEAFIQDVWNTCGLTRFPEVFPLNVGERNKRNNLTRIPGGYHHRIGGVGVVEYGGGIDDSPEFIVDTFINARSIDACGYSTSNTVQVKPIPGKGASVSPKEFKAMQYVPLELPLPANAVRELPINLRKLGRNCQVLNSLITETYNGLLNQRNVHEKVLMLSTACKDLDSRYAKTENMAWFESKLDETRDRSAVDHNWSGGYLDEFARNKSTVMPTCETLGRSIGACDGCEFRGIGNPNQLLYGQLERHRIGDASSKKLVLPEAIRAEEIEDIVQSFRHVNKRKRRVFFKYPQGGGKTFVMVRIADELLRQGKKVLFIVATHDVAREIENMLDDLNDQPVSAASHAEHFRGIENKCPYYSDIQDAISLGERSDAIQEKYCSVCPNNNECGYNFQYSEIQSRMAVIIQHAHLTSRRMMELIKRRHFDAVFIDEDIVDRVCSVTKITEEEKNFLQQRSYKSAWAKTLLRWLKNGHRTAEKISLSKEEKRKIRQMCIRRREKNPQTVMDWESLQNKIQLYNSGALWTPLGIVMVYPLPEAQIMVFADATGDKSIIQFLAEYDLEVYGAEYLVDYQRMHPGNKIIQCITSSISKTALSNDDHEHLINILEFIAKTVNGMNEHDKALLTVYKDHIERCKDFIEYRFPGLLDTKLTINSMESGTNRYKGYTCQFLVCGVFAHDESLRDEILRLVILRKWCLEYGRFGNSVKKFFAEGNFQLEVAQATGSIENKFVPVMCTHAVPRVIGARQAHTFEYPALMKMNQPVKPSIAANAKWRIESKTQQAIRIRFDTETPRVVYVFGRSFLPGFVVSDPKSLEQIIGFHR